MYNQDDGVEPAEVARFVKLIWGHYAPDGCVIELQDWPDRLAFGAMVAWDAWHQKWRIVAPRNKGSKRLLFLLCHEMAHVRAGDVSKDPYDFGEVRAALKGDAQARQATRTAAHAQAATAEGRENEADFDRFARDMVYRWWSTLRDHKDGGAAADVVRWVKDWERTQKTGGR